MRPIRGVVAFAAIACALPLVPASALAVGTALPGGAAAIPTATITIDGNGGGRTFQGLGAVIGGGGEGVYLEQYPAAQRNRILKYLFKPDYGASLQILKLEIGGDGNSTDGAQPSIEHTRGNIDCNAGYELTLAQQAVALDPSLKLYGLQWTAPGWVGSNGSLFTKADIGYLVDWLGCARQHGLSISYLGGWDERDDGSHRAWFHQLRVAMDQGGFGKVQIAAGDSMGKTALAYTGDRDVAVLSPHDNCGYPSGVGGSKVRCGSTKAAKRSTQPIMASELGGMSSGAGQGCAAPCAPAIDRLFTREYIDSKVTGVLEWPAVVSMPADVLRYEDRGILTANQPWTGSYSVNALTWALAQIGQFAHPGWRYLNSASGYLRGRRTNGSYVTLEPASRDQWSTIVETTVGAKGAQRVRFHVTGGHGLAGKTVHVWASDFGSRTGPSRWFVRQRDIRPSHGEFSLTARPNWVYSLTTTTGQHKGSAASPPKPKDLRLPYSNDLAAGTQGMPTLLAPEDGAYQLEPCSGPQGATTCTEQTAVGQPVLWTQGTVPRHPYAIIGSDLANYAISVAAMLPQPGSAGLIGRYLALHPPKGLFDGYVFDVNTDGTFTLKVSNGGSATDAGPRLQRDVVLPKVTTLARGKVPFAVGTWHQLTLSLSGSDITASVDGKQVATLHNSAAARGLAGIETGGWYPAYYSHLSITRP